MNAIIDIQDLCVEYASQDFKNRTNQAVKDLTLQVLEGEAFGFLGPNGAGKTSTMKVLLGFTRPARGTASLFGVSVDRPIARQRIGYLPELTYYYPFLTGEELLRFYGRLFRLPRTQLAKRIESALKLVELEAAAKRPLRAYSKGMRQRVGLAQALINDPDLLILDEPTSGLDPVGRMKVRDIIRRLKEEGKTVFFSSHELGEVETICDRVCILHQGELKVLGGIEEIKGRYQCDLEQAFLKIIGFQPSENH